MTSGRSSVIISSEASGEICEEAQSTRTAIGKEAKSLMRNKFSSDSCEYERERGRERERERKRRKEK